MTESTFSKKALSRVASGIVVLLFLAGIGHADTTYVSGPINANTTWTPAGNPYVVVGSVLVMNGVTLTIEPGVFVAFDTFKSLQVDGELIARGTNSDSIRFTSRRASPARGDWGYILFSNSSTDAVFDSSGYVSGCILEYCSITYAGGASVSNNGAVRTDNAHPFISHCRIAHSYWAGICGYGLTSRLKVAECTIADNSASDYAAGVHIWARTGGWVVVTGCSIIGNYSPAAGGIYSHWLSTNTCRDTYSDNLVAFNSGAGIYSSAFTYIHKNIIRGNSGSYGWAVFSGYPLSGGNHLMEQNVMSHNSRGGVLFDGRSQGGASGSVAWNVIADNSWSTGIHRGGDGREITIIGNSLVRNSSEGYGAAIRHYRGNNAPGRDITHNTITGSRGLSTSAVWIEGAPTVSRNNIFGNGTNYDLWNSNPQGSPNLNAESCWWGTSVESIVQLRIYDWFDNSSLGIVDYAPFETTARTDCPVSPPVGLQATGSPDSLLLSWHRNPESDLAGYIVHWDTTNDTLYPFANHRNVGSDTSFVLRGLALDRWYITVTAYDQDYDSTRNLPSTIINECQTEGNESWYAEGVYVELVGIGEGRIAVLPREVELAGAFPNPFSRTTQIAYALPGRTHTTLAVFDIAGREVAKLVDADVPAGRHVARLDASRLANGVYFCRLDARGTTLTRKLVVEN